MGQYLERWLEKGAVLLKIRPSTFDSYQMVLRQYLIPQLGRTQLSKLTARDLDVAYKVLLEKGRPVSEEPAKPEKQPGAKGKVKRKRPPTPLSPRSVQYAHVVLHRALKDAVRQDLLPRNPCDMAHVPRPAQHEIEPPNEAQCKVFLREAESSRCFALFILAIIGGLRQGELLGLKWTDFNLESGKVDVRRNVYRVTGKGWVVNEPKTAKGRRTVLLPPVVVAALRRHRARQAEERLAAGPLWSDEGWAFPTETGTLMERQNLVQRYFKPLLKKAELPSTTRFHDLRHAMASLLLEDGVHRRLSRSAWVTPASPSRWTRTATRPRASRSRRRRRWRTGLGSRG